MQNLFVSERNIIMLTNTNSIEVYDIAQQKFVHSIVSVPTSKSCKKV